MTRKSKRAPTTPREKKRPSSRDALNVQVSVSARIPKGKKLSARVVEEAIHYKARTGRDPRGMKLRIVAWRNPKRPHHKKNAVDGKALDSWRSYGSDAERWKTLRRALQQISVGAVTLRRG